MTSPKEYPPPSPGEIWSKEEWLLQFTKQTDFEAATWLMNKYRAR